MTTKRQPDERWEVTPGEEVHRGGVHPDGRGGTVIVREGDRLRISNDGAQEAHTDYPGAIFVRFDGPEAEKCCWLQFVWIEVLIESNSGSVRRATGRTPPSTALDEIELTTDPASPNVYVDTGSADSPCYEAHEAATAEHNSGRNGIWDRPDVHTPLTPMTLAAGQVGLNTRAITSVLHFTDYLVMDGTVVYTVRWTARARWDLQVHNQADDVPGMIEFESATRGGLLTTFERAALDREYPDQDVLP